MERNLLAFILVSLTWRGCLSVMCYWCSGVGDDRECEVRPYAVRTGPVYLNCRANFCLSAKVIDADTGRVMSFARLCDNVPRGNLCIRDSKLLTCYESCTSDLCNNGNPSPLQLPTVNYAGEEIPPRANYYKDQAVVRTQGQLGTSLLTNSLTGSRSIKSGPQRATWQAATHRRRHNNNRQPHTSPFNVMSSAEHKKLRGPRKHVLAKKAIVKDARGAKYSTRAHEPTLYERSMNVIPFTSGHTHTDVTRGSDGTTAVLTAAKKEKQPTAVLTAAKKEQQPLVYSDAPVTESLVTRNRNIANEESTQLGEEESKSTYKPIGQRNRKVTNKRQSVTHREAKPVFVKDFEAVVLGDITRKAADVTTSSRGTNAIREELGSVRSEDELSLSSLAAKDDGEKALIQTFRANATKTTADTAGVTLQRQQKENILFSTNGSTTVENGRVITYRHSKKTSAAPLSEVTQRVAFSTNGHQSSTLTSTKTTVTLPLRRSNRSKTTLPYIWKEKSSWNDDGTLNEKISSNSSNNNNSSNRTERKEHHGKVSLTDLFELQSTSHKSTTREPPVPNFNETHLAKPAPSDDDIYLKQSLTENLHGVRRDIHDQTKAGFTGSGATVTAGGKLMVSISLLFMCLPTVCRH